MNNDGWFNNQRVLADKPWYSEYKDSSGNTWLSPVTLTFLYLSNEYKNFDIEHTMCSLAVEASIIGGIKRSGDWIDFRLTNQDNFNASKHMFVIKYKDMTISNDSGEMDFFDDFFMLLRMSHRGDIVISGWRQSIPYNHYVNGYLHSHLGHYNFLDGLMIKNFCTGGSYTSINQTKRDFYSYCNGYKKELSGCLFNPNLAIEANQKIWQEWESRLFKMTSSFVPMIQHESISGGPYKMLRDQRGSLAYAPSNDQDFKDFAKIIAENAEDKRLKFNIEPSKISVKDNAGLVSFAKEHNFFEKCMAYRGSSGSAYRYDVSDRVAGISAADFRVASKKAMFCRSPFRWNGERLSIILTPKSKTIANEKAARINTNKRAYFDTQLTEHFKTGLRLQTV